VLIPIRRFGRGVGTFILDNPSDYESVDGNPLNDSKFRL